MERRASTLLVACLALGSWIRAQEVLDARVAEADAIEREEDAAFRDSAGLAALDRSSSEAEEKREALAARLAKPGTAVLIGTSDGKHVYLVAGAGAPDGISVHVDGMP